MNELVPVDKATFYATIGPMDVRPCIVTKWPYRSEYRLHNIIGQPLVGVSQEVGNGSGRPDDTIYWLVRSYLRCTTRVPGRTTDPAPGKAG